MEREEIQTSIEEQEHWAADALSGVREEHLFAASKLSDAQFLVALRDRISARTAVVSKQIFPSFRAVAAVASACTILLVAIIAAPHFSVKPLTSDVSLLADVATMPTDQVVDSLADADVDATELAAYLNMPDYVEDDAADTSDELPLTDQLLALDTGTLDEVLNNLEGTSFF